MCLFVVTKSQYYEHGAICIPLSNMLVLSWELVYVLWVLFGDTVQWRIVRCLEKRASRYLPTTWSYSLEYHGEDCALIVEVWTNSVLLVDSL